LALLRKERVNGDHPLGDMPFVVITRGAPDEDGPGGKVVELERRKKEHAELAETLSRNGRQVVAEGSGHHVYIEEPGIVFTAVPDAIGAIRK
jgi:hypothetical protein